MAELRAQQLAMMSEMAQIGMARLRTLPDREGEPEAIDKAYVSLTRSLRQTMALQTRTASGQEIDRLKRLEARQANAEACKALAAERRATVGHAVQEAIDAKRRPRPEVERLLADLDDILLDKIEDDTFLTAPVGILVQTVCERLSLPFEPSLWSRTPWAIDECRARTPGSPYRHYRIQGRPWPPP